MHFPTALSFIAALSGLATAVPTPAGNNLKAPRSPGGSSGTPAPYSIPTNDGFPDPSPDQLMVLQQIADGTLSNAPPPARLNESSFPVFQLIAFNENFEVAFFSSLLYNITTGVKGFDDFPSKEKKMELVDILQTVLAQEKLHAINAIRTLTNFKAFAPAPCKYQLPTSTTYEAIALAERFTDLVISTLQDAAQAVARNGDVGPVRGITSSLGQEGQQEGFYRIVLSKKPSEKPFLTTNVAAFLYSNLQQYIVPGSCPFDLKEIKLPIFPALQVISGNGGVNVAAKDQKLSFRADLSKSAAADPFVGKADGLFVTYFSGQLLPISVPIENAKWNGRVASFDAAFPFIKNEMVGLSIASLTTKSGFAAPGEVVGATLAAPGLIQVDDRIKSWDGF
ncbi:hypothetical protein QBC39DRAFT_353610 [Podospora conica]|nr:hypothetical protein QBC39DRAFT_353610 [Schizothecium conicum]